MQNVKMRPMHVALVDLTNWRRDTNTGKVTTKARVAVVTQDMCLMRPTFGDAPRHQDQREMTEAPKVIDTEIGAGKSTEKGTEAGNMGVKEMAEDPGESEASVAMPARIGGKIPGEGNEVGAQGGAMIVIDIRSPGDLNDKS